MPNETAQIRQGDDALDWLRKYLNSGVELSGLALENQSEIRLRAHKTTKGGGQILFYDHRADITLLGAEFLRIDLVGHNFGLVSNAVFEGVDRKTLEVSLEGGRFVLNFAAVQLSEELIPVYGGLGRHD